MDKRQNIFSLNSLWNFIPDENKNLTLEQVKQFYYSKNLRKMQIPCNWYLSDLGDYAGTVWFIKEFELQDLIDDLLILEFHGIDYFAEVFLNDVFLGIHEGYFQKFYFDISDTAKAGKNLLIVKVTSDRENTDYTWPHRKKYIKGIFNHHDCRPGGWDLVHGQDRNTGGIWNDVKIYLGKTIYFSNLKVCSKIGENFKSASLNLELNYLTKKLFLNKSYLIQLKLNDKIISEKEFQIYKSSSSKINLIFNLEDPELWYPNELGNSSLYEITILEDNRIIFNSHFGIRQVEMVDDVLYINGKRFFLRGTNIIPEQMLSNLNESKINFIVSSLKESNVNIVRVHAHVNRHELYNAFDRAGILVWQDFALQWTYDESEQFISNAVSQIKDMVNQFHYHPSIVFWCCHNEPGQQINSLDKFLFEAVSMEDNSRIIRLASNYEEHCYEGWYWGSKENYVAAPMGPLVTEFGSQALPELDSLKKFIPEDKFNNPEDKKWEYHNFQYEQTFHIAKINHGSSIEEFIENSQNYQAKLLKEAIHHYRRKKFMGITGIFQFMFIDCWESITWSVIDYFGKKKKGFFALKNAYEPLILSVNLRQTIYSNLSKKLNLEFWIINDLHQNFNDLSVKLFIDEKELSIIKVSEIEADSITHFPFEQLNIFIPENLKNGLHRLKIDLRNNFNQLISTEIFEIEYRNV